MLRSFLFMFVGLLVISCRKDEVNTEFNVVIQDSCVLHVDTNSINHLVIGDTNGMMLININSSPIIFGDIFDKTYLPIWCPSIDEVEVLSEYVYGPMQTGSYDFTLKSISDIEFCYVPDGDSIYSYIDTSYHTNTSSQVVMVVHEYRTCDKNASPYCNLYYSENSINILKEGSVLSMTDSMSNEDLDIYRGLLGGNGTYFQIAPDTMRHNLFTHERGCVYSYDDGPCYIGIRKNLGGFDKLGWIKFSWDQEGLIVHEVAIQK